MRKSDFVLLTLLLAAAPWAAVRGATDMEALRAEVDALRNELRGDSAKQEIERAVDLKAPADYTVKTHSAKLQINGLIQVWYQSIQNDSRGIVKPAKNNLLPYAEPNGTNDNDTFRIRRTELRFELELDKHIQVRILMDPARESNISFTPIPTFPRHNTFLADPAATGHAGNTIPQVLQDANIVVTDVVPHHSLTFGQFKPPSGEEAWRDSGYLNFVERAMCTSISNVRDIGAMIQGKWFPAAKNGPSRLEYAAGFFNGPSGTILSDPEVVEGGNRSDDNDDKDFSWRVLGRPVWDKEKWYGRLEMGYARTDGKRGNGSSGKFDNSPINGLDYPKTAVNRQAAWAWYRPGGAPTGWWLRGEYDSGRDTLNNSSLPATSLFGLGSVFVGGAQPGTAQLNASPVTAAGWYFATGYNIGESPFAKNLQKASGPIGALKNVEFAFRYEIYQNVAGENLGNPDRQTDLFSTQAYTAGVNYYLKGYHFITGHDTKIQANYVWVKDPHDVQRGLRGEHNNVFVLSFQVAF